MTDVEVPMTDDLQATGRDADARRLPILLLVSRSDCPYCDRMKDEILVPMLRSGDYEDLVVIRELMLDDPSPFRGFSGAPADRDEFAERYGATLSPTLLFLSPEGGQLAARIRGINTMELFSYYVDRAIERSYRRLRGLPASG